LSKQSKALNNNTHGKYPIFGEGKETVYIYYFKTYREYAKEHNIKYYPCKIGFSTTSAFERTASQGAAFPEGIIIPFIVKTKSGFNLECEIHSLLSVIKPERKWILYDKCHDNRCYSFGGGADWYLTNPREIYNVIYNKKLRDKLKEAIKKEKAIFDNGIKEQVKKYTEKQKALMSRRPLYTDSELNSLMKNNPKEYKRIIKMYEKQ